MLGGRRKLPVLAEIAGPASGETRAWSLRRADLNALAKPLGELEERRLVLVAGAEASVAALALASAAAASGRRTALLECDMAHPRLAADLGLAPVPGLHEYLRWEATAPQILQPLVLAGPASAAASGPLVCIVAGRPGSDPGTLFGLESFRHATAKLRGAYELTVVIAPPPGTAGGALEEVATGVDAVLAATSSQGLSGPAGRQLRAELRRLRTPALGAIAITGTAAAEDSQRS
jgi:Mrp family chromosome partitioning ATPase